MTMTVIYSDMGDVDCSSLPHLWAGFPEAKVIHVTRDTENVHDAVDKAIAEETDTLIICGHGLPSGLLNPSRHDPGYIINETNARTIKARRLVVLWCWAKQFGKRMGLGGFWSDMFISNPFEARYNGLGLQDADAITRGMVTYCKNVNRLLHDDVPLDRWKPILVSQEDMTHPVYKFNYDGLEFLG